jgi:hypothetical protein
VAENMIPFEEINRTQLLVLEITMQSRIKINAHQIDSFNC